MSAGSWYCCTCTVCGQLIVVPVLATLLPLELHKNYLYLYIPVQVLVFVFNAVFYKVRSTPKSGVLQYSSKKYYYRVIRFIGTT
jgi:hypothetical protein